MAKNTDLSKSKVVNQGYKDFRKAYKKKEMEERIVTPKPRQPGLMAALHTSGVIVENGLDRQDADRYKNDKIGFSHRAQKVVNKNIGEGMQKGIRYRDYPLENGPIKNASKVASKRKGTTQNAKPKR